MSAAELKELRDEVKDLIEHSDERVLRMVYAMLMADAENENAASWLTQEQDAELDKFMELDEKGLIEYSSWEEAKARILSNLKG
jgi:hypothetical protein